MDRCKYIMFETAGGDIMPIMFPIMIGHDSMYSIFRPRGYKPVSAGFVRPAKDGTLEAFGESLSLDLKSKATDSALLTRYMGFKK